MTKKEVVSLSLKLAGIYCLIMAITHLGYTIPSVVASMRRQGWSMVISITSFVSVLQFLIPFVLLLLFGVYLSFSDKLPSKMASSMVQEEKTTSFTFQDIQVLAFSIIGIWLLASAIPAFIQLIVQVIIQHSTSQPSHFVFPSSYYMSRILASVLKIALGIYLFSGGKGLVKLSQKFQSTIDMEPSN